MSDLSTFYPQAGEPNLQPTPLFNTATEISPHTTGTEDPTPPTKKTLNWRDYHGKKSTCRQNFVHLQCGNCNQDYFAPIGCHLRTCPTCAKEYGDRIFREVWGVANKLPITNTHKLRLITLGYGTKKGMRGGMEEAKKALNKIWRSHLRPRLNPGETPRKYGVAGVFAAIEFGTKNNSVHIHLLYYGPYVNRQKFQKIWKRLTGSWYVDVRLCRGARGVREVVKYISKGITGNDHKAYEIEKALEGQRRIMSYGVFYNRHTKLKEEAYHFTCPYCGSTWWTYQGVIEKDPFIPEEIHRFRTLMRAFLPDKIPLMIKYNIKITGVQPINPS
ncbi:hypothetical protein ES703_21028 [subsurface metagenome]